MPFLLTRKSPSGINSFLRDNLQSSSQNSGVYDENQSLDVRRFVCQFYHCGPPSAACLGKGPDGEICRGHRSCTRGKRRGRAIVAKRVGKRHHPCRCQPDQTQPRGLEKPGGEIHEDGRHGVALADRVGAAIKANADLFISLHVNAGFEKDSAGYELYFPGFARTGRSKGVPKGESAAIVRDMVRTKHLNESVRFAQILQKRLDPVFPRMDRGLRDAPVLILQNLNIPAVDPGNRVCDQRE